MSGPSRARLVAFLRSQEVLRPDGSVLSWVAPEHPGFAYPEAGALVLSALTQHAPEAVEERARVAEWLWRSRGPLGGIGRDGVEYTFDTAIALRALAGHACVASPHERARWETRLSELESVLLEALERMSPFLDRRRPLDSHWSRAAGPHLLKACLALRARGARHGAHERRLVGRLLALERDGRWRESAGSERCYVHAQAYALEGLAVLAPDAPELRDVLRRGVEYLAELQRPSGALPAFDDGSPDERTDATAQAIRLWLCVDAPAFAEPIARARECLARMQAASGGLRYAPDSADVNTWCSAFALQAEAWSARGAAAVEELY